MMAPIVDEHIVPFKGLFISFLSLPDLSFKLEAGKVFYFELWESSVFLRNFPIGSVILGASNVYSRVWGLDSFVSDTYDVWVACLASKGQFLDFIEWV